MGKEIIKYRGGVSSTFTWTMPNGSIVATWYKANGVINMSVTYNRTADIPAYGFFSSTNTLPDYLKPTFDTFCERAVWNWQSGESSWYPYAFIIGSNGYIHFKYGVNGVYAQGWGNPYASFIYLAQTIN